VYEVDKNAKYELHFAPSFYDDIKENSKKNNDVAIKVDPSQYEDNIDEAKDVMKKYVDAVYLNGESSGGGTNLSATDNKSQVVALADDKKSSDNSAEFTNDAKADKEEFIKKAKVDYKVKTYLPDYAVVYVRPETIDLDNLNVYELSRKFYEENKGKYSNYSEAMKAGEKYILENAPSQFDSTPLDTSDNMKKEGYEIKMTKKDGKWTIDTSSKNYDLKDMARTFRGGIGY